MSQLEYIMVLHRSAISIICLLLLPASLSSQQPDSGKVTVIYFVRHGEVDPSLPTFPLSDAGHLRAGAFARAVRDVAFTHVFSSHTTRARQMVEPVARQLGIALEQRPLPGTRVAGTVISDSTPSQMATTPLLESLRSLPPGSSALVGVNSDNIYAILHGLGVAVAAADRRCAKGSTCVPCLSNTCFPGGYDQLWILIVDPRSRVPKLIELRYGSDGAN